MDAQFIQSAGAVGDRLEITLVTGATHTGVLEELTLQRLLLRRDDGTPVAVALPAVVSALPAGPAAGNAAAPVDAAAPAAAGVPAVPDNAAAPATAGATAPIGRHGTTDVPTDAGRDAGAAAEAAPAPAAATPEPEPPAPDPPPPADPAEQAAALAEVGALPVLPVDFDIWVAPEHRNQLLQIRNSYEYAERVKELDPRFGRIGALHSRTLVLWNADQSNAELLRLLGVFTLLKGDLTVAHRRAAAAVEDGDPPAMRLQAVTSARLGDPTAAATALLRFFTEVPPADDPAAWRSLVRLLDAHGTRSRLGVLLDSPRHDAAALAPVREALAGTRPDTTPLPPPAAPAAYGPVPREPDPAPAPARPGGPPGTPGALATPGASAPAARSPQLDRTLRRDPYQRAKYLEHRVKDLVGAKAAYRKAIRQGGPKRESAIKDLAWITRRTDGPEAALRVLEVEYPDSLAPGNARDNILIDFLTGARRYTEALQVLDRQRARRDLTDQRRLDLHHQIAYVKLADGQDSIADWELLYRQTPHQTGIQRGLAMALIQRGTSDDLARAEQLITAHDDDRAADIRKQIEDLRLGRRNSPEWVPTLLEKPENAPIPPLVDYIMRTYSEHADRVRRQLDTEDRVVSSRHIKTLANLARQSEFGDPENSAKYYVSAAVLAQDFNQPDPNTHLYRGLTQLAGIMLSRQAPEAARDLYCAALVAYDERDERDEDDEAPGIRSALVGFLTLLDGPGGRKRRKSEQDESSIRASDVSRLLRKGLSKHGRGLFELLPVLIATTVAARDLVLEALCSDTSLLAESSRFLRCAEDDARTVRSAWGQRAQQWMRQERRLVHTLEELPQVTAKEAAIGAALDRVREHSRQADPRLAESLHRITESLDEIRRFLNEESFEARERSLQRVARSMKEQLAEINRAPTALAVEIVEPTVRRLQEITAEAQRDLIEGAPPVPRLSLALERSSGVQNGVVTVQIKVANLSGAPIESAELTVGGDDTTLFSVVGPRSGAPIALKSAVPSGEHRIEAIRLHVTEQGLRDGAFSLPVKLRYLPRSSEDPTEFGATLPVQLARDEEFQPIANPYTDGATGRPVEDPEMFFGREEVLDRIRDRLRGASSPGVGVAVFGQKRAGKSSIRLHLTQQLRYDDHLPVVDVRNIGDMTPDPTDPTGIRLIRLLVWRILEGASAALLPLAPPGSAPLLPPGLTRDAFLATPEPVQDYARLYEEYRARTPGPHPPVVVLIDEFQYFDRWIREGLLSPSFMQTFKAIIERRLFHLVIVGQAALDRLIKDDPNSFGVFSAERVTYLSDYHARRLITEPIWIGGAESRISRYRERASDRILDLTGGSAFYIQRFCYEMVEYMNAERVPFVTEADVERVRDTFLTSLEEKDFDNLESPGYTDPQAPSRAEYQQVLLAVARASRHRAATIDAIRAQYAGGTRLHDLLEDLVTRDVVRREQGTYRIVVRIYQDWLLKYFGSAAEAGAP
ncbi:ATP-binding protein [Nocardiopsis trehalosi]|uniref:ATP-binding protein n=1 Tax=Nocardiopsis trehalosi TaxID=109329 RepID=UPI0008365FEE|nr:ATP-binding protein [Nocardiopsis trehalosi]